MPTALVAGLGLPALGAMVFLAVPVIGVTCWVSRSDDRTDRFSRMLPVGIPFVCLSEYEPGA